MRSRLLALLLLASAGTYPASAFAAPPPSLAEAKQLTSKASIEYDVGHFDQALELYTRAYELYPKPALLFDIGQCHRLLGHHERAVFFFQGYLRGQPDAPNRALVEQLIAESQRQLQAAAAAPSPTASGAPPGNAAAPAPATGDAAAAAASPAAPSSAVPAAATTSDVTPSSGPAWTPLRIAGVATAGVGVALLVAGIVEGAQASSLSSQVAQVSSSHGAWTPQAQSNYDAGKSAATAANVLFVTGAIALAGGAAATWLLWPRARSAGPVTASVVPLPGGASGTLVARF